MNNYEIVSSEGFYYVMNNGVDEILFTTLEEAEEYIRHQEE